MRPLVCASILTLLSVSCRSTDTLMTDARGGGPIAQASPAAYRIAVLPVEFDASARGAAGLDRLGFDGPAVTTQLVEALQEVRAASQVVAVSEGSYSVGDFDLVFEPRLIRQGWQYDRTLKGRAALSSLAWLGSWVGGLFVDDKRYSTDLSIECALKSFDEERFANPDPFDSGAVNLTFLDRNKKLGGFTLLSLIAPPFLLGSSASKTSDSLQERSMLQVATEWKNYLRWDHTDDQGLSYTLTDIEPANGSTTGGSVNFACTIRTSAQVEVMALAVNDQPLVPGAFTLESSGTRENRVEARNIALVRGDNFLSLWITVGGIPSRHTFHYVN